MKSKIKQIAYIAMITLLNVTAVQEAHAAPEIVTGTKNLATDALTWVLLLVPVTAAMKMAYHAWMKSLADGDPGMISQHNQKMKNTLISAVIAETASALTQLVLGYYS